MKLYGLAVAAIFATGCAFAQTTEIHNDIPASFTPPKQQPETVTKPEWDYIKRVEMVPMRDGTKLYTVIVIPKGAKNAHAVQRCITRRGSPHSYRHRQRHVARAWRRETGFSAHDRRAWSRR